MIALYPIKPVYSERILSGEKKYELRKRLPKICIKYVLIYSTYPVGKIVGYAEIRSFHKESVFDLWRLVSKYSGIDKRSYLEYFNGAEQACAIEFERVFKFVRPFSIKDIRSDMAVPQSFCYVDKSDFHRIKRRKSILV